MREMDPGFISVIAASKYRISTISFAQIQLNMDYDQQDRAGKEKGKQAIPAIAIL
jgi:hypothetical protein